MRGPKTATIRDFSAGLVQSEGGVLPLGAAQAMQNVLPLGEHGLKTRDPTTLVASLAQSVRKLVASLSINFQLGFGTSNVYRLDTAASLGAHGVSAPESMNVVEAVASGGQGPLYYGQNGVAKQITAAPALAAWTASAGTLPVSSTGAMTYHGNRMWVGGDSVGNYWRLYFSEIADPRIWSGGTSGYVDMPVDIGPGGITAVCPCGPYLLVCGSSGINVVYDLNTGANRALTRTVGVLDPSNITQGTYGTAYLVARANRAVAYVTDGNTLTPISPGLGSLTLGSTSATGRVAYIDGVLLVHINSGDMFAFVEGRGSWWQITAGAQIGSWWGCGEPIWSGVLTGKATFLIAGLSSKVYRLPLDFWSESPVVGEDADGSVIASKWWGGDMDLDAPELRKRLRSIDVEGAGTVSLGVTKDGASSAPSVSALTFLPAASTIGSARLNNLGVARYWAPYLSSSVAFSIRALTMNYSVRAN